MFEITYNDSDMLQNYIDADKAYHGAIYDFTFEGRFLVYHFFVKDTARYVALDSNTGYGSEVTRRRKGNLYDQRSYRSMTPLVLDSIKYTGDKRYLNVIVSNPLEAIESIFRVILPEYGFAVREEQIKLSMDMYRGLVGKQVAICEAEVGTGKTMAYLVASFIAKQRYAAEYGFDLPVTISTSSIELQKMIVEKEIPQLSRMLQDYGLIKHPLSSAIRKGKEHYFCKARYYDYISKIMANKQKYQNLIEYFTTSKIAVRAFDLDQWDMPAAIKGKICVKGRCSRCEYKEECRYSCYVKTANEKGSIVKRMERGEYVDSNAPYGFRLHEKKLAVYDQEADIVRYVFHQYLSGWSTSEIARDLTEKGIQTKLGKEQWRSKKISYILSNERYVGDCRYQKTYRDTTVPFKQSKNRGQEDMFYASDTHEPIIDREAFDKVQALLQERQERFSKTAQLNIYPLTSRIRCSECGSFYRRKVRNGAIKWVCAKHNEDTHACPAGYYSEERIYDGFITMVNKLRFGEERILDQVIAKLETAATLYKRNNSSAEKMSQSIAELNAKLVMLEQLRSKGYLAVEVYQAQARDIQKQISNLKADRKNAFESVIQGMLDEVLKLRTLLTEIEEPLEEFDEKLFYEIVKDVVIAPNDEMTITVLGGLKFTELI